MLIMFTRSSNVYRHAAVEKLKFLKTLTFKIFWQTADITLWGLK